MPNHIANRITVLEGQYDLSGITTFNTLLPMPKVLRDATHDGVVADVESMLGVIPTYFSARPTLPELEAKYSEKKDKDALRESISNQIIWGATTWYRWSVNNWGTKWDMYEVSCDNNILEFQTAWASPMYWFEALSKTLPEGVVLKAEYADEDAGSNAGIVKLSKDKCDGNHFDNGSDEAWQMAIKLNNLADLYQKIDGEWVCTED